jgi:hypothetical protein
MGILLRNKVLIDYGISAGTHRREISGYLIDGFGSTELVAEFVGESQCFIRYLDVDQVRSVVVYREIYSGRPIEGDADRIFDENKAIAEGWSIWIRKNGLPKDGIESKLVAVRSGFYEFVPVDQVDEERIFVANGTEDVVKIERRATK